MAEPTIRSTRRIEDRGLFSGSAFAASSETGRAIAASLRLAGGRTAMGEGGMFGAGSGSTFAGGTGLPTSFMMNSPAAVFKNTLSRLDKLRIYRYFAESNEFVGRAIELHSELPLSRMSISPPKGPDSKLNKQVNRIYESTMERIDLLDFNLEVSREYWGVGEVYIWVEWDKKNRTVKNMYVLPCEYIHPITHPFLRDKEILVYARPIIDTAMQQRMIDVDLWSVAGDPDIQNLLDDAEDELPEGMKDLLAYGDGVPLNTDPSKGSFVYHLKRNQTSTSPFGQCIIDRNINVLLILENLINADLQTTSRNMNPKQIVCADAIGQGDLDELRLQVDLSMLSPTDYCVVTSYPITWTVLGANERFLNNEGKVEELLKRLAVGLGTTVEMLTGQSTYGGQRFTMELMNTQYLNFREMMIKFNTRCFFRPIAEAHGHYYYEKIPTWIRIDPDKIKAGDDLLQEPDGKLRKRRVIKIKTYTHSEPRFNRLSIRDSAETYDQLFQLHQKGSLALRYLLDLHNIDSEENANALTEDTATNRDPTFNRILEGAYQVLSERLATETDLFERVVEGLNLDAKSQQQDQVAPGTPIESTMQGGGGSDMPMGTDMMGGGAGMGGAGMMGDGAIVPPGSPNDGIGGPVLPDQGIPVPGAEEIPPSETTGSISTSTSVMPPAGVTSSRRAKQAHRTEEHVLGLGTRLGKVTASQVNKLQGKSKRPVPARSVRKSLPRPSRNGV